MRAGINKQIELNMSHPGSSALLNKLNSELCKL